MCCCNEAIGRSYDNYLTMSSILGRGDTPRAAPKPRSAAGLHNSTARAHCGVRAGGYWVSDTDGLVRIPKHDQPRLRLRVGLRNEEAIEFDARSLPDDAIPLTAPRDLSVAGNAATSTQSKTPTPPAAVAPTLAAAQPQPAGAGGAGGAGAGNG